MVTVRGRVQSGRLKVDEPVDLPDDAEVTLVIIEGRPPDDGDELDDEERERLHAALDRADAQCERGEGIPAEQFLAEMRSLCRGYTPMTG